MSNLHLQQREALARLRVLLSQRRQRTFTYAEFASFGLYRAPWPALQRLRAKGYVARQPDGRYTLAAPHTRRSRRHP
jgi:hypothetical protein